MGESSKLKDERSYQPLRENSSSSPIKSIGIGREWTGRGMMDDGKKVILIQVFKGKDGLDQLQMHYQGYISSRAHDWHLLSMNLGVLCECARTCVLWDRTICTIRTPSEGAHRAIIVLLRTQEPHRHIRVEGTGLKRGSIWGGWDGVVVHKRGSAEAGRVAATNACCRETTKG